MIDESGSIPSEKLYKMVVFYRKEGGVRKFINRRKERIFPDKITLY